MTILNVDGYPTEEFLKYLETEKLSEKYIEKLLKGWYYEGYKIKRCYKDYQTLELHTYGWSGNESIISSLKKSIFWFYWQKSEAGGHHYFKIPCFKNKKKVKL